MKKIKFIKNFSSPVYGNVYIGREVSVKGIEAEKQVALGNAELIEKKSVKPQPKAEKDGDSKPKRGKRASKGRSKL